MAFIRLKKISGKQYAVLVENTWTSKGPRQSAKKYLGRYVALTTEGMPEVEQLDVANLIKAELLTAGFSEQLTRENIKVSLRACTVREGRKRVVLGLNGGFLCDYTLRQLLRFQPIEELTPGYKFARAFSDAGVRVSREQFVMLYKKVYKKQAQPA